MTENHEEQMSIFDLDIWCGRMFQEPSQATEEKTSEPYSKKQRGSLIKTPLFLDLRETSGLLQEPSWETGGALLGEYTMHSFGECPSEERESRLSQILEDDPLPRYCLSARACQGILNRANKRGKKLPEILETALKRQAELGPTNEEPLDISDILGKIDQMFDYDLGAMRIRKKRR